MPFCSLTVKAPPLILTLRAFWNIFGWSRQLKDFVAVVPMPCCAHVVRVQSIRIVVWLMGRENWELNWDCGSDEMSRCNSTVKRLSIPQYRESQRNAQAMGRYKLRVTRSLFWCKVGLCSSHEVWIVSLRGSQDIEEVRLRKEAVCSNTWIEWRRRPLEQKIDSCSSSDDDLMKSGDKFAIRSQSLGLESSRSHAPFKRHALTVILCSKGVDYAFSCLSSQIPPKKRGVTSGPLHFLTDMLLIEIFKCLSNLHGQKSDWN